MRKTVLVLSWFLIAPLTIIIAFFSLFYVRNPSFFILEGKTSIKKPLNTNSYEMFTALPQELGSLSQSIESDDARPLIIKNFLVQNQSPLAPFYSKIFEVSYQYGLDFRLLPAIAMQESNLGKKAPEGSYNAWGFANGETKFTSWEEAIEEVAQTLKAEYIDQGLETPEEIMPKYAPPSVEKGGPWAKGVRFFMEQMQ